MPDCPRPSEAAYVYATRFLRVRGRLTLGLPPLRPPGPGADWEICAISYLADGVLVTWRCPAPSPQGDAL